MTPLGGDATTEAQAAIGRASDSATPPALINSDLALPSAFRGWCYLVWLSIQRQARVRQMVYIAVGLLVFTAITIALVTQAGFWNLDQNRVPRRVGISYRNCLEAETVAEKLATLGDPLAGSIGESIVGANRVLLANSGFIVFSRWMVFGVFLGFLLPLWSLSFATEALGGERESRSLVWLLSRPLPRSGIYLAKFIALLPWSLGLTVGGFAILCVAAGAAGIRAFAMYWPPIIMATLAFCALFHFMAACFRRPAVLAILYTFFLETIMGTMPGYMKRFSITFYTRCIMYDIGKGYGLLPPERDAIYLPVSAPTAWLVLSGATAVLLLAGMVVFARSEYREDI